MDAQPAQSADPPEQAQAVGPAGAYAQALLELAVEQGLADEVGLEIQALAQATSEVADLPAFLASPVIPLHRKLESLRRCLGGKVSELALGLLNCLLRRERGALLQAVADQYRSLLQARNRQVQVLVEVAVPLAPAARGELEAVLSRELRMTPILQVEVVPDLLGGLRLTIGGRVIDASLAGRLLRLRDSLIHAGLPGQAVAGSQ
jgi:F-type H+-transporting ATPase subunit delta